MRVVCVGVVGVVGMLRIGALEVDCVAVVESLVLDAIFVVEVLGAVFVVEVGEGVELVVGCTCQHMKHETTWNYMPTPYPQVPQAPTQLEYYLKPS